MIIYSYTTDSIEQKYYPKVPNEPSITQIDRGCFIDNNGFLRTLYTVKEILE